MRVGWREPLFGLVLTLTTCAAAGQQQTGSDTFGQAMAAYDAATTWQQRQQAFRRLVALREPSASLLTPDSDAEIRLALIRLLRVENARQQNPLSRVNADDYTEYLASLIGTVARLNDARAIEVLVDNLPSGRI